ncbi:MAG: minichromosome maintenance protein MCM [Candidatus Altiarchaeota archaeon]
MKDLGEHYPDQRSLVIDFEELFDYDRELAEELRKKPDEIKPLFESTLKEIGIETDAPDPHFHVRFMNMPKQKGYSLLVREITAEYIGKLISAEGIVNRVSDVLPKVTKGLFVCTACGEKNWQDQGPHGLTQPFKCQNCTKREFRFDPNESEWIDIQKLEIQEPLELLRGGEQARRIEIYVEDDFVDQINPGDKMVVTGILRLQPPKNRGAIYTKYLEASHLIGLEMEFEDLEISEEEEKEIKKLAKNPKLYDKIIDSIAPSIYGYREVKHAIALQLFGGSSGKILPDKTTSRSDIHILLIGDPGVAKSKMLQYVDQIAPKSIYVTGKGTTGAGLTATAEKDEFADGAWTLKAGALVLAGGGICMIDEFDKMGKEDRSSMHEAMEQQTISIAKAGIITKFKANTSVLAASNPKFSRFDSYKPLYEQFDIPPTLLSRFDLIFPIRDILDKEQDRAIADHIMKIHTAGDIMEKITPEIDQELFTKYIAYARKNFRPQMSDDAAEKLKDYYVQLRSSGADGTVAATPRQLDALVRLSEASAKVRLSPIVSVSDADRAIELTNFVLREIALDTSTGLIDIDRIVTDHPKSRRDKIRIVEEIISELVEESDNNVALADDIIAMAKEKGMDKSEALGLIDELKKVGNIYEPKHNNYMLTDEV